MELVSLFREPFDETEWFGYVVAENADFLAIHCVSDRYDLDGYRVFRQADIDEIDEDFERRDLIGRAMAMKGLDPKPIPWLGLDSLPEMLRSIQEHEPVLVLERELASPDECEVGRIRPETPETYSLLWMTTMAEWEYDDQTYRYDEITQVSFGGEYEQTLARLAGPWPQHGG